MTGNVQTTKMVSMQATLSGDNISLTISGGPDLSAVQALTITVNGVNATGVYNKVGDNVSASTGNADIAGYFTPDKYDSSATSFKVGDTIKLQPNSGRLLVVGKWPDGAEQIIIEKNF